MNNTDNNELAISLQDVWVQYRLRNAHHFNLKRTLANTVIRLRDDAEIITALQSISIEIKRGERIGLTGANGSGKSTLLAVMAGALTPTRGTAQTNGKVLALLGGPDEGLDPEQTGRENAISIGVRLGEESNTMAERMDDIQEFSGLGGRFDHPVFTYSSGMQVRLRFTAITSIKADVLLVDEGIGAADSEFNERASTRLNEFYSSTGTLVLASHAESLLSVYCESTLRLEDSKLGNITNKAVGT